MSEADLYRYAAAVVRVVDGDTFDADVDLGFDVRMRARIRVLDIDTPELHGPDKTRGEAAKRRTEELLAGGEALLHSVQHDHFGRCLAHVWLPGGELLADVLRREGHAK